MNKQQINTLLTIFSDLNSVKMQYYSTDLECKRNSSNLRHTTLLQYRNLNYPDSNSETRLQCQAFNNLIQKSGLDLNRSFMSLKNVNRLIDTIETEYPEIKTRIKDSVNSVYNQPIRFHISKHPYDVF